MKKLLIITVALWMAPLSLSGNAAAENNIPMAKALDWNRYKNMAVFLQWDFNHYDDTEFFDFWGLASKASNRWVPDWVGYELKLPNYFALDLAVGYSRFEDASSDYPEEENAVDFDMDTVHFQCSVKRYEPVTNLISLYGGFGADIVYVDATLDYQGENSAYRQKSDDTMYGGHALIGVEYHIRKKTLPFSVDLSLKYTILNSKTLDRELIDTINAEEDTGFSSRDLDLGGFTLSTGIKYHF